MTNVAETNGTVNFDQTLTDTRAIWREAVAAVAEKAKATLPQCNGRIDKALALVLAGDVDLLGDGTARVASQSNGQTVYHIVNGQCDCKDYSKASQSFCKHRLSAAIAKGPIRWRRQSWKRPPTARPHRPASPHQRSRQLPRRRYLRLQRV